MEQQDGRRRRDAPLAMGRNVHGGPAPLHPLRQKRRARGPYVLRELARVKTMAPRLQPPSKHLGVGILKQARVLAQQLAPDQAFPIGQGLKGPQPVRDRERAPHQHEQMK